MARTPREVDSEKHPLGAYIREGRERRNLTIADAAPKVGCSPGFLSSLELGSKTGATDRTLGAIADTFGLSLARLKKLAALERMRELSSTIVALRRKAGLPALTMDEEV